MVIERGWLLLVPEHIKHSAHWIFLPASSEAGQIIKPLGLGV
jgi:hypothetical protein